MYDARIMEILEVQEKAMTDEKYLLFYGNYACAQENLCRLMGERSCGEVFACICSAAPSVNRIGN